MYSKGLPDPRSLSHVSNVGHRTSIAFEAPAQLSQVFIREELQVAVLKPIVRQPRQSFRCGYVEPGRIDPCLALPLLGQKPGDIELRRIGVRRLLENRFRREEHRQEIVLGPRECDLSTFALNAQRAAYGTVEGRPALA